VSPSLPQLIRAGQVGAVAVKLFPFFFFFFPFSGLLTDTAIVIVVIICRVDGKPSPVWYLGTLAISVNAVVALAAEVAKMCIIFVSGSLLAQFKWEWFAGGAKALYDLKRFDDAAHGEWGSTRLLTCGWRKARYETRHHLKLPIFGALCFSDKIVSFKHRILAFVMLTSLLTPSITQQILEYRTALVPATEPDALLLNATVPVVQHLTRWDKKLNLFTPSKLPLFFFFVHLPLPFFLSRNTNFS